MRGKSPCHNPFCPVLTGNHGHTQRRCWTSSCVYTSSTSSMTQRSRRVTRRPMRITPRITRAHHQARTRTEALHHHTSETPLHGGVGIDLHLGQKPKLGGRYTDITLIYLSYSVGSLYIHFSVSLLLFVIPDLLSLSKTQKDQKYFCCFSLFISLVGLLYFLVSVIIKNPKRFCFVCLLSSVLVLN